MDHDNLAVEYPRHHFPLPEKLPVEEDTALEVIKNSEEQENKDEEEEDDERGDDKRPECLTLITEYVNVSIIYGSPPGTSLPSPTGPSPPKNSKQSPRLDNTKIAAIIVGAVGTGVIAAAAAPLVLTAVGFGSPGIVAGSLAAAWQSTIGNVAAGSLFATLQSAGAAGLATSTSAAIGAAGGTVGGLVTAGFSKLLGRKQST